MGNLLQDKGVSVQPINAGGAIEATQIAAFTDMLFRHVDWSGEVVSLLGIGEKGTPAEGVFRDRQFVAGADAAAKIAVHAERWGSHGHASFIVPAVVKPAAVVAGDVKLDKVAALTAIILDLDSGDVLAKWQWAVKALGPATMAVASGGKTEAGLDKIHLYWRLSEPCAEVESVALWRKTLAAKCGGDQSFGRATQVIRVPGTVHGKDGVIGMCRIIEQTDSEIHLDDAAEAIEAMQPMPGLPAPTISKMETVGGFMDFSGGAGMEPGRAVDALHRDVHAGGDHVTRWGEFSKVVGFHIAEVRAGRYTAAQAVEAAYGWMLTHMVPPWPRERFDTEFQGLVKRDIANHGPFPQAVAPSTAIKSLPLEFFSEIEPALSNSWLVRDLIPQNSLVLVYGSPGHGKSFLVADIALRVAAGMDVDGRAVQQCPAVYVAAEGQTGFRKRVKAFRQYHSSPDDVPFALVPSSIDLFDAKVDLPRLFEAIDEAAARFDQQPGLIVVDTLAATFGSGDENTKDMVGYVNNLGKLRDRYSATVAVVHHRPKDHTNNTPRGHGSLAGAMDTILLVEMGAIRSATVTKQKDAEAGTPISFALATVTLGQDEDGEPVTSAVVTYFRTQAGGKPLAKQVQAVLTLLTDLLDTDDAEIDTAGKKWVAEHTWRQAWIADGGADKTETSRRTFSRHKKALINHGVITVLAGRIALAPDAAATCDATAGAVMDYAVGAKPWDMGDPERSD